MSELPLPGMHLNFNDVTQTCQIAKACGAYYPSSLLLVITVPARIHAIFEASVQPLERIYAVRLTRFALMKFVSMFFEFLKHASCSVNNIKDTFGQTKILHAGRCTQTVVGQTCAGVESVAAR